MTDQRKMSAGMPVDERDADSRVDMWCSIALVLLAWGIAIFWVSGQ